MLQRFSNLFLFITVVLTLSASCKRKQEDVVADAKRKCAEINEKLPKLSPKRVEDLTNRGGGYITGYYRDNEVKKVSAEHFSDTSRTFVDCYFDDGMLILIRRQHFVYNKPMHYTEEVAKKYNDSVWYDDRKTVLKTSLFYFNKNKLVKWVDENNTDVKPESPEFFDEQSLLIGEAAILLKQLKG